MLKRWSASLASIRPRLGRWPASGWTGMRPRIVYYRRRPAEPRAGRLARRVAVRPAESPRPAPGRYETEPADGSAHAAPGDSAEAGLSVAALDLAQADPMALAERWESVELLHTHPANQPGGGTGQPARVALGAIARRSLREVAAGAGSLPLKADAGESTARGSRQEAIPVSLHLAAKGNPEVMLRISQPGTLGRALAGLGHWPGSSRVDTPTPSEDKVRPYTPMLVSRAIPLTSLLQHPLRAMGQPAVWRGIAHAPAEVLREANAPPARRSPGGARPDRVEDLGPSLNSQPAHPSGLSQSHMTRLARLALIPDQSAAFAPRPMPGEEEWMPRAVARDFSRPGLGEGSEEWMHRAAVRDSTRPGLGEGPGVRADLPDAIPPPDAHARAQWPILGLVQRATAGVVATSAPVWRMLRNLPPAQARRAMAAIVALPALGAGQPIPATVRQPLATLLRRDLAEVRLHISPAAEVLGAEAMTSGHQVVFAPGRLDLRSHQGLALLGHELSHIGQPLAFKQTAGAASEEAEERAARQQEEQIQSIIEGGWPAAPSMEVRRAAQALASLVAAAPGRSAAPGAGPLPPFESVELPESAGPGAGAAPEPLPTARVSEVAAASGGGQAASPDLDALARQVYALLKTRLRAERDRH